MVFALHENETRFTVPKADRVGKLVKTGAAIYIKSLEAGDAESCSTEGQPDKRWPNKPSKQLRPRNLDPPVFSSGVCCLMAAIF